MSKTPFEEALIGSQPRKVRLAIRALEKIGLRYGIHFGTHNAVEKLAHEKQMAKERKDGISR